MLGSRNILLTFKKISVGLVIGMTINVLLQVFLVQFLGEVAKSGQLLVGLFAGIAGYFLTSCIFKK